MFGASNLLIIFYGLKHMPMADVNMISAGSPIWVVIFARIFLKEPLKVFDVINVFVTLLGILFIIRSELCLGVLKFEEYNVLPDLPSYLATTPAMSWITSIMSQLL